MNRPIDATSPPLWINAAPPVFVVLWSTGYIGAKFGLPYAEPFTFLLVRFAVLTLVLALISVATKAPWPGTWAAAGHWAVVGLLVQGTYLGGIFAAIHQGMPAGVAALIAALQPLATAVAAGPILGERMAARQWLGLVLGLSGVVLVVAEKLDAAGADLPGVLLVLMSVAGITAGTLYQKRFGGAVDLRTGSTIQFAAAAAAMAVLAPVLESMEIRWTGEFVFALAWLIVVLSLGAISLLHVLIRRGAVSKVASLFYLVAPATALSAYALFGEALAPPALAGMAVAVLGVAMVTRG